MKRLGIVFLVAGLAFAFPGASPAAMPLKVGLVTDIGGLNDRSFNQLSYEGLLRAAKELGVHADVVQSTAQTDYVQNLTRFAQGGYNLVISVGFLMKDATAQVSKQFPQTHFLLIDDVINDQPNVSSAVFSTEQCGYLVGALAAMVEGDKTLALSGIHHTGTLGGSGASASRRSTATSPGTIKARGRLIRRSRCCADTPATSMTRRRAKPWRSPSTAAARRSSSRWPAGRARA